MIRAKRTNRAKRVNRRIDRRIDRKRVNRKRTKKTKDKRILSLKDWKSPIPKRYI